MSGFPKGFIWGAACAAYQCEGAWNEDGKSPSIWDDFCHDTGKGHVVGDENADVACDTYRRYPEDIALMKQIGLMAYRFSVSWPRVMPQGTGAVNEAGLDYYDRLIDMLLENGIEPWVTLYHWDLPSALQKSGGWQSRATVEAFREYTAVLAKRFDGRVKHYITINEPQCVVGMGYGTGEHAPGLRLTNEEVILCYHHLALAHSVAAKELRTHSSTPIKVGLSLCGRLYYPEVDSAAGREAAYQATFALTDEEWDFSYNIGMDPIMFGKYPEEAPLFVREFEKTVPQSDWNLMEQPDFLGVNVYDGRMIGEDGKPIEYGAGFPLTGIKWPVTPEVMHHGLCSLYRRYGLPICITENGQSCNDRIFLDGCVHDPDRIDFLHRYLLEIRKAIDEGVPVMGYLHWSFLDNFEWAKGFGERFGIVYMDYATQRRTLKDSAHWYAGVIKTNGKSL